jgi:aldehyde dehydrogenase (NAD+)
VIEHERIFIGGEWRRPSTGDMLEVVSPASEEVIGRVPLAGPADVAAAAAAARRAFDEGPWPHLDGEERRAVLKRAGAMLEAQADQLDALVTSENGTLLRNHPGHTERAFRYLAEVDVPAPEDRRAVSGARAQIVHEPAGVVAAIVPWNGPLWLAALKVIPALLAGCTVVLKPAPETPLDSYPLVQAFADAGLPPGVLNVVTAHREVAQELVASRDVDVVSFTGSTAAGRRIGAICGEQIKRVFLELGGKSAAIILDDADVEAAVPAVLAGGMLMHNGQSCVAWSRVLVPASRHDEVVDAICDHLRSVRIGDPSDATTDLGPLVSSRQRGRVEGYIALAQQEGATVAFGGGRPKGLEYGWYVEPTLLTDATNSMRSSREEIFGPVASVITYRDVDDAVRIANDSDYGLSGAVFTADVTRGLQVAGRLRTGSISVNQAGSDLAFPFGGYKASGLGRQNGPEGLLEYLEIKTIALPAADVGVQRIGQYASGRAASDPTGQRGARAHREC